MKHEHAGIRLRLIRQGWLASPRRITVRTSSAGDVIVAYGLAPIPLTGGPWM